MYQKRFSFITSNPDDLDQILKNSIKSESKYGKSLIIFALLIVFYIIFGSILLYSYASVEEVRFRYDGLTNNCTGAKTNCSVFFTIENDMTSPIYFFYELKNFYQNHRKYMQSFSYDQFQGKQVPSAPECWPSITNGDMEKNLSLAGNPLDNNSVAFPCGLIAKTFFNDTFLLFQQLENETKQVFIRETDLVPELKDSIKLPVNFSEFAWIDISNEHFLIWMKISVYPKFRKLWGMIDGDLPKGNYQFLINDSYPVGDFAGEKYLVLSTKGILGFKNLLLVVGYFVAAFICLLFFALFFYLHRKQNKKKAE